jgi:hypothetical protein
MTTSSKPSFFEISQAAFSARVCSDMPSLVLTHKRGNVSYNGRLPCIATVQNETKTTTLVVIKGKTSVRETGTLMVRAVGLKISSSESPSVRLGVQ